MVTTSCEARFCAHSKHAHSVALSVRSSEFAARFMSVPPTTLLMRPVRGRVSDWRRHLAIQEPEKLVSRLFSWTRGHVSEYGQPLTKKYRQQIQGVEQSGWIASAYGSRVEEGRRNCCRWEWYNRMSADGAASRCRNPDDRDVPGTNRSAENKNYPIVNSTF